jgi:hypothetical protein
VILNLHRWVDSAMQTDNSDKENNRKHIFMESTTTILFQREKKAKEAAGIVAERSCRFFVLFL